MRSLIVLALLAMITVTADRPLLGGDGSRNPHGCIASAGFSWCETTQMCQKLWETPCPAATGKTHKHETRCNIGAGLTWCETKQKCIKKSTGQTCPEPGQHPDGGANPQRCLSSAGFMWCAEKSKCVQPWNEPCATLGATTGGAAQTVDNVRVEPKKVESAATRRHRVDQGAIGDGCASEVEGVEFCIATQTCIPTTECESVKAHHADGKNNHQVSAGRTVNGFRPACEGELIGMAWCEKADRCLTVAECQRHQ